MNKLFIVFILLVAQTGCSKNENQKSASNDATESPGEKIVKANCKVCHAQGINGAPVIGNKKMWTPRLEKGIPQLIANASSGVGLMPAKGGNTSLTEEDISLAVNYLVDQVK